MIFSSTPDSESPKIDKLPTPQPCYYPPSTVRFFIFFKLLTKKLNCLKSREWIKLYDLRHPTPLLHEWRNSKLDFLALPEDIFTRTIDLNEILIRIRIFLNSWIKIFPNFRIQFFFKFLGSHFFFIRIFSNFGFEFFQKYRFESKKFFHFRFQFRSTAQIVVI